MRGAAPLSRLEHPGLVPASLLPPEDPMRRVPRTLRDWLVDVLMFLAAVLVGLTALDAVRHDAVQTIPDGKLALDLFLGAVACLALWLRRQRPVGVAALTVIATAFSTLAVIACLLAVFTVAVHRRTSVAGATAAAAVVAALVYAWWVPTTDALATTIVISVAAAGIAVGWGMFVRARRQLVWSLRERAERAEAEQRLLADTARIAERGRIAREMHDVLAHRISLLALHAGALEVRPDLPGEQVQQTAALLRVTARQALEELRDVIGVLREELPAGAPTRPLPTLRDLPRLIAEHRGVGAKIDYECAVPDGVPDGLGRDAYRIVQESLTNAAKHATGTATSVRIAGERGVGIELCVRNRLPVHQVGAAPGTPVLPGSGSGLIGLAERVALAGGTLRHGRDGDEFVVEASLPWR